MMFLAVTGGLMAFQSQITRQVERSIAVSQPSSSCSTFSSLAEKAHEETMQQAASLTVFSDPRSPALYSVNNDTVYLIDPCTGVLLESGPSRIRAFFSEVKDLHRWVAFGGSTHKSLRSLKDGANLLFGFVILSGVILWLPRQWKGANLRAVTTIHPGLKGRARAWNLHHVAGFWFAAPFLAMSLTGTVMAYGWANAFLYRMAGSPLPKATEERIAGKPAADLAYLDALVAIAKSQDSNWKIMTVRIPMESDKVVSFTIDDRLDNQPRARNLLTLSRQGKRIRWEPFNALSRGRQWRLYARFLHSGELFGVLGQLIALMSVAALLLLIWTGFAMSIRRFIAWRKRTARLEEQTVALKAV
jgi:uncharacterized iron-regulated membrane protein